MDISSKGRQFQKKEEVDKFLQDAFSRPCSLGISVEFLIDNWFNQLDDLIHENRAENKEVIFYALDRFLKVRAIIKRFPDNFNEKVHEFLNQKEELEI